MPGQPAVVFATVLVALSGCVGGTDPLRPVVDPPIAPDAPWERILLSTEGEAGDWLVASQTLPVPVELLPFDIQIEFMVHGADGPWAAILMEPAATYSLAAGDPLRLAGPLTTFRVGEGAETITVSDTRALGRDGSGVLFHGFVFGVAATAPWTLRLAIQVDNATGTSGPDVSPELLARGNGTTYTVGGTRSAGLPNTAAGQLDFETTTAEAGWTHVGLLANGEVQRIGVQRVTGSFASGRTIEATGRSTAVDTPIYNTASPTSMAEQFGELANTPGLNRLQATYVRAAAGEDAFALHMPGAHAGLPPGLAATGYPDTGR